MNMIEKRKQMRGQGGFTLIELLVVVAILAVLGGAAIIGVGAMRGNAQTQVCSTNAETIETAAEAWALDSANNAALTVTDTALVSANYLKKALPDFDGATRASATAPFTADKTSGGKC